MQCGVFRPSLKLSLHKSTNGIPQPLLYVPFVLGYILLRNMNLHLEEYAYITFSHIFFLLPLISFLVRHVRRRRVSSTILTSLSVLQSCHFTSHSSSSYSSTSPFSRLFFIFFLIQDLYPVSFSTNRVCSKKIHIKVDKCILHPTHHEGLDFQG